MTGEVKVWDADKLRELRKKVQDWRTAPAGPMPTWVDTGTAIIDKSNIKAFRDAIAAHPKPL
jgi:hypothetical protein